jgi:hypothetical protein
VRRGARPGELEHRPARDIEHGQGGPRLVVREHALGLHAEAQEIVRVEQIRARQRGERVDRGDDLPVDRERDRARRVHEAGFHGLQMVEEDRHDHHTREHQQRQQGDQGEGEQVRAKLHVMRTARR